MSRKPPWGGGWGSESPPCGEGDARGGEGVRREPGVWKRPPPPARVPPSPYRQRVPCEDPGRRCADRRAEGAGQTERDSAVRGGSESPRTLRVGGRDPPQGAWGGAEAQRQTPPLELGGRRTETPKGVGGDRDPPSGGRRTETPSSGAETPGGGHRDPRVRRGQRPPSWGGDRDPQAGGQRCPSQEGQSPPGGGGQEHRAPQVGRTETPKWRRGDRDP